MSVGSLATAAETGRADLATVARGGALALAGTIVAALFGFLLTVVVSRGLRASGAGVFFEALALFTILASVCTIGADSGLVRAIPRYRALHRIHDLRCTLIVAATPVAMVSSAVAVGIWLAAPGIAYVLFDGAHQAEGVAYLRIFAPFLVLAAVGGVVLQGGTRGFGSLRPYVVLQQVFLPVSRPLLVLAAIGAGLGGVGVALAWAAPIAVCYPIATVVLLRQLRATKRLADDSTPRGSWQSLAREFWLFTGPRGLAAIFEISIIWFDVLLIGALRSTREAGIYAAASRFVTSGTLAMQAMRLAFAPLLSAMLARHERQRAEDLYRVATQWVVAASWPLYLALGIFGPLVLGFLGHDFSSGATALAVLCAAMLVNLGAGNANTVLLMGGKSSWTATNTAVALAINVGVNLLLVPRYGMTGAALAWAASIVFDSLAGAFEVRYLLHLNGHARGFGVAALASLMTFGVGGVAVRAILGTGGVAFLIYATIAIGCYSVWLWRSRQDLDLAALTSIVRREAPQRHVHPSSAD